jgi:hypothetical protein
MRDVRTRPEEQTPGPAQSSAPATSSKDELRTIARSRGML